jgi:hypothetical protein
MLLRSAKENQAAGPARPALKKATTNRIAKALYTYSFFQSQSFGKGIVGAEAKAFDSCNDAPYCIVTLFNS